MRLRHLGLALGLGLLPLVACPSDPGPHSPEECEAQRGYLQLCATYFEGVAQGYANVRTSPDDEAPISALLEADGCVVIELSAGDYQWQSEHLTDTCISDWTDVSIEACEETTEVSIELGDYCFDGR